MYHNSLYTDEIQSSVYQEDSHVMDYITYLKDYYKTQFAHPFQLWEWKMAEHTNRGSIHCHYRLPQRLSVFSS